MANSYEDIIHLPHHRSQRRPHMSPWERAVQFAPFAALTGYDSVIQETARLTQDPVELSEDEKACINETLLWAKDHLWEELVLTLVYFAPDAHKSGGEYRCVTGQVKKIDDLRQQIVFDDGLRVGFQQLRWAQISPPCR